MKDFIEALKEAFPGLALHPRLMGALLLFLLIVFALFKTRKQWGSVSRSWSKDLYDYEAITGRWVFVDRSCSEVTNDWKYYSSHTSGLGETGDDLNLDVGRLAVSEAPKAQETELLQDTGGDWNGQRHYRKPSQT
jgi:hypothetical protein